jgi:hypothetical protein
MENEAVTVSEFVSEAANDFTSTAKRPNELAITGAGSGKITVPRRGMGLGKSMCASKCTKTEKDTT